MAADKVDVTANYLRWRQFPPEEVPPGATWETLTSHTPSGPVLLVYARASEAPPRPRKGKGKSRSRKTAREPSLGGEWALFATNRETTDSELASWGEQHIPGFLGVRARSQFCDLYPDGAPMRPGSSCILNLDFGDYGRGGTHWVAVRVAKDAPLLLYFDAFGLPPPREVTLRGRRDGRGILYPDIQYQDLSEVNCGPRALAVLHYLATAPNEMEAFGEIGQV